MSTIQSDLLLGQEGGAGYGIERSLRFNSSDSAYLSRTPASAGNRKTWTWAGWVKRSRLNNGSGEQFLFECFNALNSSQCLNITFFSGDQLSIGSDIFFLQTSSVYRDLSAWYHIVLAVDTTQATANNRIRLYVNGSEVTQFSTRNNPSQNADLAVNQAALHAIGKRETAPYASSPFDGYLADIHFIDGQALTPSSFTEVSATTGQLIPKAYTGTFTGNSFWLKFADNSAATATTLGKDSSGLGNNWTPNNLSVISGGPTSVAAASGALPIYNTTDTYGATKGTGTRTDSGASSINLALPMDGANNGTTFTDESATIRGSGSARSISRVGDAKTVTASSKFYGSSAYFDGSGDYLRITGLNSIGTGSHTVECWFYLEYIAGQRQYIFDTRSSGGGTGVYLIKHEGNGWYWTADGTSNNDNSVALSAIPINTWVHVAIVRNGTAGLLYVNGVLTATTSGNTGSLTSTEATVFAALDNTVPGKGYCQDFRMYSGFAKYTSNFNPPSSTQNPTIAAGNDSLVDTPTSYGTDTGAGGEVRGNYCTWNPLNNILNYARPTNGNLAATFDVVAGCSIAGTMYVSTGKWYWEVALTTAPATGDSPKLGIVQSGYNFTSTAGQSYVDDSPLGYAYRPTGQKGNNGILSGYGASFAQGDIIGFALDLSAGTITAYKNGVSQGVMYSGLSGSFAPCVSSYKTGGTNIYDANFGQRPFAYTAPSGFKALCDTNLPAPVVAKPNSVFDVALWTGNATARNITGLNYSPDLVWIKGRSPASNHFLFDTVRGATNRICSSLTVAEASEPNTLTAFNSDGFSLGTDAGVGACNQSGQTYVGWTWDAGSTTVTNTQGSITSQVRTNGYLSIVTYTGNGTNPGATIGHGLGVTPGLIITKARSAGSTWWPSYHSALPISNTLYLNSTVSSTTYVNRFSAVSSTTFTTGSSGSELNDSGVTYVAYCFAPVAGYSSFGSYTGNGSADGPFVYTGFRPRWLMIKSSSAPYGWAIHDTQREPYNVDDSLIYANSAGAEANDQVSWGIDILSNGFKIRTSAGVVWNNSGSTFVYACFAESPFALARAR